MSEVDNQNQRVKDLFAGKAQASDGDLRIRFVADAPTQESFLTAGDVLRKAGYLSEAYPFGPTLGEIKVTRVVQDKEDPDYLLVDLDLKGWKEGFGSFSHTKDIADIIYSPQFQSVCVLLDIETVETPDGKHKLSVGQFGISRPVKERPQPQPRLVAGGKN